MRLIALSRRIPLDRVGPDTAFTDLGIDSMGLVALTEQLSHRLGWTVSPTLLYSHPDIRRLAQHLEAEWAARAPAPVMPPPSAAPRHEPMAVVGMACRMPGAPSLGAY